MSSPSSISANPKLIVIDTSVLVQLVAAEQKSIFRILRSDYGVQAGIVHAVESEVFHLFDSVVKFRGRQLQLRKALGNNTLALVDREFLAPLLGTGVDGWIRQMDSEGERLHLMVDRGEAFSHAASMVLGVPIATNDTSAVHRLLKSGETAKAVVVSMPQLGGLHRRDAWREAASRLSATNCRCAPRIRLRLRTGGHEGSGEPAKERQFQCCRATLDLRDEQLTTCVPKGPHG